MSGVFVDKCEENKKLNVLGRWYKPWFYKHVETFLEKVRIPSVHFFIWGQVVDYEAGAPSEGSSRLESFSESVFSSLKHLTTLIWQN